MLKHIKENKGFYLFFIFSLIASVVIITFSLRFWKFLSSNIDTIEGITLLCIALTGLFLAIWRTLVSAHQTRISEDQTRISERKVLNEYFFSGLKLLGDSNITTRISGIYSLSTLAKENPKEYHVKVMEQFCAFVRQHTKS